VETDGRETNRVGSSGVDNVVPFPRDWIGPLDDLVPIGSSAEDDDECSADAFAADAFWSEGSASLHQLVEAAPERARGSSPGEVPVASEEAPEPDSGRPAIGRRLRLTSPARRRVCALGAAASILLGAGAALAMQSGSAAPSTGHHRTLADLSRPTAEGQAAGAARDGSLKLARRLVARAIERTSRGARSRRRTPVRHDSRRATATVSPGGSASHLSVAYELPPSTTPVTSTSSPTASGGGSPQRTAVAASGRDASGTSGPEGAGSPFGPGQMTGG
jgi:hypothetical protein